MNILKTKGFHASEEKMRLMSSLYQTIRLLTLLIKNWRNQDHFVFNRLSNQKNIRYILG